MAANNQTEKIDEKNFETLFRQHFYALVSFANHFIFDTDASKDIVHNVFINLWENREHIHLESSLKSWLFTSVKNRSLNYIRDHKKFVRNVPGLEAKAGQDPDAGDQDVVTAELEGKIKSALDKLPDACRKIFIMIRFDGLKYRETAEKLGISQKTVETQMSRAFKILRDELKDIILMLIIIFTLLNIM